MVVSGLTCAHVRLQLRTGETSNALPVRRHASFDEERLLDCLESDLRLRALEDVDPESVRHLLGGPSHPTVVRTLWPIPPPSLGCRQKGLLTTVNERSARRVDDTKLNVARIASGASQPLNLRSAHRDRET